ncbi:eukaryotic and archaeal DNA primase, large subunit-domain-containing protein [Cokeromyces recurvatus]|uniref:eukaryotic and archaeal DNA primase, large subunit-domain-containing protein n=1 Tax=Cokeromyces recurvatus TaxID=90255 RepID=UPI002220E24F|nr:eukaryotic and archaeal DNA primase, large subunit-domain-containing protein [Cokeromyces recurvatus]KAI7905502.1 eukaryotic and archaeal DNA primase, large subunit-domain-containing protein [Cokeromyces recurvatus]
MTMTVLHDNPVRLPQQHQQNEEYNTSESEKEEAYDITEFDLDVVDDALLNPDRSEYLDHFGFKIHVKTDDELSSDDESEVSIYDDEDPSSLEKQNKEQDSTKTNRLNVSSSTTTMTSDDDSIDTNITTPHPGHDHDDQKWLSENVGKDDYDDISSINTLPHTKDSTNCDNHPINDKEVLSNTVPILKSPPSARSDKQKESQAKTSPSFPPSDTQRSNSIKKSTTNRQSILSTLNKPFNKKSSPSSKRPSSTSSPQSPVILSRPSQSFQQRQSKRYSEAYYLHQQMVNAPRSSAASNYQHFDELISKFRKFSHNDHRYDSEKHTLLKEKALEELKLNKSEEENETKIDWGFWELVILDFGSVIDTQMDDLRQHLIQGGIPSSIRGLLWQIISKSHDSFDMEIEYKEILKKSTSPFEKQIRRDITRTFPQHTYFMQEANRQALFNVAKAYSIFDQEVGYCQGLAFIIGCLLLHMSEEAAFCVLIKLMGKYGLRGHFTPRMEILHQHMYQFDHVFQQKLPVVHRHVENEGVTPSMYVSQWFITLFAYRCPIELCFRVIDLLLIEGAQVLIQIALALVIRNQEQLLKLKFEALVDFLSNQIFNIYDENDGNRFIEDVYRVELPAKFMARLAQQYTMDEEVRESRQSMSQEDNLRRINGQLSEHIRSVEGSLQVLRVENQDLTQQIIHSKMDLARAEDEKEELRHELGQLKAEFEKYKKNADKERKELEDRNNSLEKQLLETESMLIDFKVSFAERENEFETLKRQLQTAEASVNGRSVFSDNGQSYNLQRDYPHRLNFYLKPPPVEITIEEFEQFALDRLKVLRAVEAASIRNEDLKLEISKTVDQYLPLRSNLSKSEELYEERRKDHISHFVLRMAYCRSEDLREWFLNQETALFKYRFEQESFEEKKKFLQQLDLNWKMLTDEEKESMREELEICSKPKTGVMVEDYVSNETFFEVDFEKVPYMVSNRSVYVKGGKAYVPMNDQINIVMLEFKNHLSEALEAISKLLPRLEEDDRLKPILLNVEKQYTGRTYNDYAVTNGTITAKDVEPLVQRHAPLCMRNLQDALKANKHLKHDGRLQYGLFLKGIGLSVGEALIFWRTAFSNITDDKFRKEYAYNIRYNYGLEGKRVNYSPYSCMKIITSNPPSVGEHHGCPFRHFSPSNLEARLRKDGISGGHIQEILELARNKHYQLACTRHFEVTHPENKEKIDIIEHPNQYYELSKKLAEKVEETSLEDSMEVDA